MQGRAVAASRERCRGLHTAPLSVGKSAHNCEGVHTRAWPMPGTRVRPRPRTLPTGMDAIVVAVRRNGVVEAKHRVHAVAVRDGVVIAEAGAGGELTCFMRSSSKPIQALPLARSRPDLDARDLA